MGAVLAFFAAVVALVAVSRASSARTPTQTPAGGKGGPPPTTSPAGGSSPKNSPPPPVAVYRAPGDAAGPTTEAVRSASAGACDAAINALPTAPRVRFDGTPLPTLYDLARDAMTSKDASAIRNVASTLEDPSFAGAYATVVKCLRDYASTVQVMTIPLSVLYPRAVKDLPDPPRGSAFAALAGTSAAMRDVASTLRVLGYPEAADAMDAAAVEKAAFEASTTASATISVETTQWPASSALPEPARSLVLAKIHGAYAYARAGKSDGWVAQAATAVAGLKIYRDALVKGGYPEAVLKEIDQVIFDLQSDLWSKRS